MYILFRKVINNMKKFNLLMTAIPALLLSNIQSFAGEGIVNNLIDNNKPNTGDTNTMLIYGGVVAVVIILLLALNLKKPKKDNSEENNEVQNSVENNNIDNNNSN